jgi:hypothetical protein
MVNRSCIQDALGRAEHVFDHPECFVNMGHRFRVMIGVGAQKNSIVFGILAHLFLIDGKIPLPLGFAKTGGSPCSPPGF